MGGSNYDTWKLDSPYEQTEAHVAADDLRADFESEKCEVLVAFACATPEIEIDLKIVRPESIEEGDDLLDFDLTIGTRLTVAAHAGGLRESVIEFLADALAAAKRGAR